MTEDIRRVIQDLVAPDLKALHLEIKAADDASKHRDLALIAKMESLAEASKLRDDALSEKTDRKFELVVAEMDSNHASLIYSMNIEKRVDAIEKKAAATM